MPLNLDSCITGIFVPGNIGASSGLTPVAPVMPPIEPSITSSDAISNLENEELAHALTSDKMVTWSIVGGADAAKFELSGSTLRWLGDGTKDYETPDDADTDNDYEITVRATDVTLRTVDQTITVTVTDVLEVPPTITSSNTVGNLEDAVLAHALTADETVTWSIVGGADAARFEISGSTLRWLGDGTKDFEAPDDADTNNAYVVTVRATDVSALTTDQTITVTVTDVADFGPLALVASWTFASNVAQVDFTGLAGYNEVRVAIDGISASVVGQRQLLVSTNNGSSFLTTSGDYITVSAAGVESNATSVMCHQTASTGAASGEIAIIGWNLTALKIAQRQTAVDTRTSLIPTGSALNALRVNNSAGGNLTAGAIYVYAR